MHFSKCVDILLEQLDSASLFDKIYIHYKNNFLCQALSVAFSGKYDLILCQCLSFCK